ncbi:threonine/serine exporter [Coprococcus catus]|nr:threonine/serine exporter family protein [Coprococcus catus]MBT9769409.1 threonine/serine exporter [Coprococcus catus]
MVIQLLTGATGAIGFGILFHTKRNYLPLVGIGGAFGWFVYVISKDAGLGIFFSSLLAGLFVDFYAEILARVCKETSTAFFVPSVIPMIPGSTLYYCMSSIVENELEMAWQYGKDTFLFAFGIAAGMSIAWAVCDLTRRIKKQQKKKLAKRLLTLTGTMMRNNHRPDIIYLFVLDYSLLVSGARIAPFIESSFLL